jgi:hypothetical protein
MRCIIFLQDMGLRGRQRLLASLLCVAIVGPGAPGARAADTSAAAVPVHCEGTGVQVVGADKADFRDICQGVLAARGFLAGHGMRAEPILTVEVTDHLPEEAGPTAVGCFVQANRRAYVKSYGAFKKERRWFGIAVSRDLYRALATHETAHAVAACHFSAPSPSIQAKEYLAYVAMFSTMSAALRAQALKALPGQGFPDIDRVSAFVYLFDPMLFGANAYRHFQGLEDPAAFLEDVLSGMVLRD